MKSLKKKEKILLGFAGVLYLLFLAQYGIGFVRVGNVDLPSFYRASQAAFVEGDSPYDYEVLSRFEPDAGARVYPYVYPPPSLLVFYPFSIVSYETAKSMMLVANHLSVVVSVYLLLFEILGLSRHVILATFALIYIYIYDPIVATIYHGQVNLIVLAFICFAWLALKRGYRSATVALPLSMAILIKTYPALILVYLVVKKKLDVVLWTLAFLAVFAATALLVLPSNLWADWVTNLWTSGGYGRAPVNLFSPAHPWNQSLNGFFSRIFLENEFSEALLPSPILARILPYVIAVLVLWITGRLCWSSGKSGAWRSKTDLEVALFLTAMVLVAPLSWQHHLVFVLPAVMVAGHLVVISENSRVWRWGVGISAFLLAWRLALESPLLKGGMATLLISMKFYASAILWLYLAVELRGKELHSTAESEEALSP